MLAARARAARRVRVRAWQPGRTRGRRAVAAPLGCSLGVHEQQQAQKGLPCQKAGAERTSPVDRGKNARVRRR